MNVNGAKSINIIINKYLIFFVVKIDISVCKIYIVQFIIIVSRGVHGSG